MRLLIILILFSGMAHAQDQWRCTDEAITHTGNTWSACGVGQGMDESDARQRSLEAAVNEFKVICNLNSDCKGRDKAVEPKRTTCGVTNESSVIPGVMQWKCYRLVQFTVN